MTLPTTPPTSGFYGGLADPPDLAFPAPADEIPALTADRYLFDGGVHGVLPFSRSRVHR